MLIKYVRKDGQGDYTDIQTAFAAMVASGLIMGGDITEYLMLVDSGIYSVSLSGYIPYSGLFTIQGSGTIFDLTNYIKVSGEYQNYSIPNLILEQIGIIGSGTSYIANIPANFGMQFIEVDILENKFGIINNGSFQYITGDVYCSTSGNLFINNNGYAKLDDVSLSNYNVGLSGGDFLIMNSRLYDCNTAIYSSGNITMLYSNCYKNVKDININSGYLSIYYSTLAGPIYINNTFLTMNNTIVYNYDNPITSGIVGTAYYDSTITNCCFAPVHILPSGVTISNVKYEDPKFYNPGSGDFRLLLSRSPCIEMSPNTDISDSVEVDIDVSGLKLYDKQGPCSIGNNFIYSSKDTIVLTDFNKEIKFAEAFDGYNNLTHNIFANFKFNEYDVQTMPSFDFNNDKMDLFPWDWDMVFPETTKIQRPEDKVHYVIPRSYVDITTIIPHNIGNYINNILYRNITKSNIQVFNQICYKGISYDQYRSKPGQSVIWLIEAGNQALIKQDLYNAEMIDYYPLLCPVSSKVLVSPSGLIYTGVQGNNYTFITKDDPNTKIIGKNQAGEFDWYCTNLNTKYDLRGVLNFKDNLFITGTNYVTDVLDRTTIQKDSAAKGILLYYNNDDLFYNYFKLPDEKYGPSLSILSSGNYYPTDLTMYEDGTLMIADYYSSSGVYRYKFAYDYALIQASYLNENTVLLREYYSDVNL